MDEEISTPVENIAQVEAEPTKQFTQSQIDEIVKHQKLKAAEKARRELTAQHQAEIEALKSQQMQPSAQMGGMVQPDQEQIYAQIKERLMREAQEENAKHQQEQHEREMQGIARTYLDKMSLGKDAGIADDFEAITSEFNPASFPQLVMLASQMDNLPHIMYELASNPSKLATIDYLAQRDPKAAKGQLEKLSKSIMANLQAKESNPSTNPPLSKMKPSPGAGADNGKLGLRDYKSQDWLKG